MRQYYYGLILQPREQLFITEDRKQKKNYINFMQYDLQCMCHRIAFFKKFPIFNIIMVWFNNFLMIISSHTTRWKVKLHKFFAMRGLQHISNQIVFFLKFSCVNITKVWFDNLLNRFFVAPKPYPLARDQNGLSRATWGLEKLNCFQNSEEVKYYMLAMCARPWWIKN